MIRFAFAIESCILRVTTPHRIEPSLVHHPTNSQVEQPLETVLLFFVTLFRFFYNSLSFVQTRCIHSPQSSPLVHWHQLHLLFLNMDLPPRKATASLVASPSHFPLFQYDWPTPTRSTASLFQTTSLPPLHLPLAVSSLLQNSLM